MTDRANDEEDMEEEQYPVLEVYVAEEGKEGTEEEASEPDEC